MKKSIYGLTPEQLSEWLMEHGQKRFRADQIWDWLYIKRVTNFSDMKNINKELWIKAHLMFIFHGRIRQHRHRLLHDNHLLFRWLGLPFRPFPWSLVVYS